MAWRSPWEVDKIPSLPTRTSETGVAQGSRQGVLDAVGHLFPGHPVFVMLEDEPAGTLVVEHCSSDVSSCVMGVSASGDSGPLASIARGVEPVWVPSLEDLGAQQLSDALGDMGIVGVWFVPLPRPGGGIGLLALCVKTEDPPLKRPGLPQLFASLAVIVGAGFAEAHPGDGSTVETDRLWDRAVRQSVRTEELTALLASIPEALFVQDRLWHVTLANESAFKALGVDPGPGLLHTLEERLDALRLTDERGASITWRQGPVARALLGDIISDEEFKETSQEAVRWFRIECAPIRDTAGSVAGVVVFLRDVTALRIAHDRLEVAIQNERTKSEQLRVLNRLAVILNSETDTGRMLDEVLAGALRLTTGGVGSLYRPSSEGLRLEAFLSIPELREAPHGSTTAPGLDLKEVAQLAAESRRVVRFAQENPGVEGSFRGYLAVPLVTSSGDLLACLALAGSSDPLGFGADDEIAMTTLAAHASVALENVRRLDQERKLAEYLQRAMLPRIPRVAGLAVDIVYESATDAALVGGDFYDVVPLAKGGVALFVGDVCGNGLQAAATMSTVRYAVKAHASLGLPPGPWLGAVNVAIAADLPPDSFVTLALLTLDPKTRRLGCALAGHPSPLLATEERVVELPGLHGLPLGVDADTRYHTRYVVLEPGQMICLFTDGLFEARRGGEMFGTSRLGEELLSLAGGRMSGAAKKLVESARSFAGDTLDDDVVVMLARLSAE